MIVSNTTALDLLGKQVSFIRRRVVDLPDKSSITLEDRYSGVVTQIVLNLTGNPEIAIDDGDYFSLPGLIEFKLL